MGDEPSYTHSRTNDRDDGSPTTSDDGSRIPLASGEDDIELDEIDDFEDVGELKNIPQNDHRSSTTPEVMRRMSSLEEVYFTRGGLHGEDTLPAVKKEFWAWYSYDWANSSFASCAISVFIPLFLQDIATADAHEDGMLHIGSAVWAPTSFAAAILSISVVVQAFVFISVGALADFGNLRKKLLIITSTLGGITLLLFVTTGPPGSWWWAAVLTILANVFFGTSVVFYNAFLPLLVAAHPDILEKRQNEEPYFELEEKISNEASTYGFMAGYVSGVLTLIVSIVIVFLFSLTDCSNAQQFADDCGALKTAISDSGQDFDVSLYQTFLDCAVDSSEETYEEAYEVCSTETDGLQEDLYLASQSCSDDCRTSSGLWGLRTVTMFCGVWWLAFSIYTFKYLNERPGPALPKGENYVAFSWKQLISTLKEARRLKYTFRYLIIYFVYSDGYSTIAVVGVLFGKVEFGMSSVTLGLLALLVPGSAFIGNIFWLKIQKRYDISARNMVVYLLLVFSFVPFYSLIGLIPGSPFGLIVPAELFAVTAIFGFCLGAVQAYTRVVFTDLIPPGREAQMFSLYEITDKGSSWMGPLVVSLIFQATGEMRYALGYIIIFTLGPVPFLLRIDVKRGKEEARVFSEKMGLTSQPL